jgi:hypothetical protein
VLTPRTRAIVGGLVWLHLLALAVATGRPAAWPHLLLAFTILVLAPLVLDSLIERRDTMGGGNPWFNRGRRLHLPAALLAAAAGALPPGAIALGATLPWLVTTTILAVAAVWRIRHDGLSRPLRRLCGDAALLYLAAGAAVLLIERQGAGSDRDQEFMLQLALRLHLGGLLLPVTAGWVQERMPESRFAARAAVGAVLGIPVAVLGATSTQLGWGVMLEAAGGTALAVAGMMVAILHVRFATEPDGPRLARALLALAGTALFFASVLAGLHAARGLVVLPGLGFPMFDLVPAMLYTFGFGLGGVLGWRLLVRVPRSNL